ncbi:endolytic transglycosylase MltG [Microbacterium sp. gxy059]|uniref:endolytic transglycosylase MltG n=1 Tax=Microbacterium sp. gxy059 TaxID=2957199 RepID=UPI003D96BF81
MTDPSTSPHGAPLTRREMRSRQRASEQTAADDATRRQEEVVRAERAARLAAVARAEEAESARDSVPTGSEEPARAPREEAAPRPTASERPAPRPTASAQAGPRPPRDERPAASAAGSEPPTQTASTSLETLFDDGDGPARKERRRRGGCAIWAIVIVVILGGAVAGGLYAIDSLGQRVGSFLGLNQEPADYEEGEATGEALVAIAQGDTGYEVSVSLYEAGVTLTESAFYDMLVRAQQNPEFQPGVYRLQQKMTSAAALAALEDPDSLVQGGVGFPEGTSIDGAVPVIATGLDVSEDEVRAALEDPADYGVDADSLEGWLFPATYNFGPDTSPAEAIQAMVDRTRSSLDSAGVSGGDAQRILTIASIIEREARFPDDFYKVSRVIENRIDSSNPETHGYLQMDSTAQYGYGEMHDGSASSTQEALDDDNPWNTYQHTGLPAGPISNPGDRAIDAAMNPAAGDWLYFVTVDLDSGETVFTNTYAEHEEAVQQWQEWCADNPDRGC